jgi:tRNA A-37 threonylcarbamoyl transferase component Bud32/dienelactone hydrolase
MKGETLGHCRILDRLGAGGMGEVYLAEDTNLKRRIALKVLPPQFAASSERLKRFQFEAEAIAALNHPNIVTVYSVEEAADSSGQPVRFLTMELVEGNRLDDTIPAEGLPLEKFFDFALQLVAGVAAAHARGVIHRDLKPSNIMIAADGRLKILDFGLAKLCDPLDHAGQDPEDLPTALQTELGKVLGTPAYMAPEQAEGAVVDARADVFALGAVLFELLTGSRPFLGESAASVQAAILTSDPRPPSELRAGLPTPISELILRCLNRDPEARFASAGELEAELGHLAELYGGRSGAAESRLRRQLLAPAAALVLLLAAVSGWLFFQARRADRVRTETIPEIERLLGAQKTFEGFRLGMEAQEVVPEDPLLAELFARSSDRIDISTEPEGAEVFYQDYRSPGSDWIALGTTPLVDALIPHAYLRWRLVKPGYETLEVGAESEWKRHVFDLTAEGAAPAGMMWVPAGSYHLGVVEPVEVGGFFLDRFEVTNREFQEFVDAGGYGDARFWKQPFELDKLEIPRQEALGLLVDTTGRAGPATWSLGRYPDGEGDYPVRGVSWYEAAAYAEFAGKSLPSLYHWRRAAPWSHRGDLLLMSNLEGEGPAPVGTFQGTGRYGHSDLAGNVTEWCWNRAPGNQRYIVGGSWLEPSYTFTLNFARAPFDRQPDMGFRLASFEEPVPDGLMEEIGGFRHDFRRDEPVSDETFEFYRSMYAYDPQSLESATESVDETNPHFRRETVSFSASYGGERVLAHLFLPRTSEPPYQAVVYVPGSFASFASSIKDMGSDPALFLPRSGRALIWPAYKSTLERGGGGGTPDASAPRAMRDRFVHMVNDLQRTVDYLETRDDIESDNLAFLGLSAGAEYGPVYTSIETRFRTLVFWAGGFDDTHMLSEPPEVNPWNYAPRVTTPVLMINGRSDYGLPVETAQKPMFDLLAAAPEDKRHVILDGGHVPYDWNQVYRETLLWLDHYLGPN